MFKKMRYAGDAGTFVHRADLGHPAARNIRIALSGNEQKFHAVVERVNERLYPLGISAPCRGHVSFSWLCSD